LTKTRYNGSWPIWGGNGLKNLKTLTSLQYLSCKLYVILSVSSSKVILCPFLHQGEISHPGCILEPPGYPQHSQRVSRYSGFTDQGIPSLVSEIILCRLD